MIVIPFCTLSHLDWAVQALIREGRSEADARQLAQRLHSLTLMLGRRDGTSLIAWLNPALGSPLERLEASNRPSSP